RDRTVTGVQTCALPISPTGLLPVEHRDGGIALLAAESDVPSVEVAVHQRLRYAVTDRFQTVPVRGDIVETSHEPLEAAEVVRRQIGRASCRERVYVLVG